MGFFDFLSGGQQNQVLRQCKRVANINGQPEDREAAARWLAQEGSEQAILGLLGRFDVTIENHMKDAAEKEFVYELLYGLGPDILEPTKLYVAKCKAIAFPLRLLDEVGGRSVHTQTLLDLLDIEAKKEDYKADRKKQLLVHVSECRDPRIVDSAARFLGDFDEGVRYTAAEAIIAQDGDAGRLPLLGALAHEEEESNRLRVRIAEIFHSRKWSLEPHADRILANPPAGWRVSGTALLPA